MYVDHQPQKVKLNILQAVLLSFLYDIYMTFFYITNKH